ncbi:MAG: PAS domain-containing protein [Vicinamibacteria bacterium]|nr:PAS domain-containing protein [Vicinamibacteria bacterium]
MARSLKARWRMALAALLIISAGVSLDAAEDHYRFGHLTIEDALSNNWVFSILKDSEGFLWFGTENGLNRYDGAGFKIYRHDPDDPNSLPSPVAGALYEDARKRLWVGSHQGNAGVALYDREHDRFKRFLPVPGQPIGNNVRVILEDGRGRIWLGTDNGIATLDPKSGKIQRYPLNDAQSVVPEDIVNALFEDRRGRFWVGSSGGLLQFDRETGKYARWPGAADDQFGLHRADIRDFQEEEDRLWIATLGSGLHRIDPETGRDVRYLPDPRNPRSIGHARVSRIASDKKGTMYVGTENGGLKIFDMRRGTFRGFMPDIDDDQSLNSNSIYSLYLDDQGTLWIGTFNGGVNYLSPYLQRFQRLRAGRGKLNDPHVSAVLEDHLGVVWIGTDGGGLNRFDPRTGAFSYYRSDPNDPATIGSDAVWALCEDGRRKLWLGGWDGGLGLFDRTTGRVTRFRHDPKDPRSIVSNHVWRIVELHTGELLVVTQAGADLFDRDAGVFTHLTDLYPGAGEDALYSGAEDGQGNLWIVGNTFVGQVNRRTRQVARYRSDPEDPERLGSGGTQAVLVDSLGNVWFGTQGGLSCLVANARRWVRYTTADGLSNNTILGIVEDASGSLWISTGRGIDKIVDAVHAPREPKILNFNAHDGLQSQDFARNACFRSPSGTLYFGGARGLNFFSPENVVPNPRPPKVVLTDLKIFNESVRPGLAGSPLAKAIGATEELTLSHEHAVVTFEFAALSYALPRKNEYAYKLEGFDRQWNSAGTLHTATYTNLPRGRQFILRVKASNNDGVWNEEGAVLKIYVTPRWYERWLTRIIAALLLVAAAVGLYRMRVGALKARERELAQRVEEKTTDLQKEIGEHKRTEERLARENEERQRAEEEARQSALRLKTSNDELIEQREALKRENAERRRAEEAAGRERDLLHSLMDNIPDLIYFKDTQSRFVRVNAGFARALGASSADAALGKSDADYFTREFADASSRDERDLFKTGRTILGKLQNDARNARWYLATKAPIRDSSGKVVGLVGISKDITERKQAEERMEQDLQRFLEVVSAVAQGDLTQRGVEGDDTLGRIARAMNRMSEGFATILDGVYNAAFAMSSSSAEILAAATQIAKGAQYGNEQVESTSAAVEEMAASMAQVSKNAASSSEKARLVLEHVEQSERAVNEVHAGTARIDAAATETAEKMRLLEERSGKIFEIIELIEELASQSALLSLNAAIEAAHAGDAGRGFAVVAEEVRRLADRSKEATNRVAAIVDAMVEEMKTALGAMERAMREVKTGRTLSDQAIDSLGEISGLVQDSASLSAQISSAAREQARVTTTVAGSMQSLANMTHESAAGASSTSTAVGDLVKLSEQLTTAISRFRIDRVVK